MRKHWGFAMRRYVIGIILILALLALLALIAIERAAAPGI